MNFYDKVNDMISSFKDMDEYKQYIALKGKIKEDEKACTKLKEFKDKQQLHQLEFINTGTLSDTHKAELENLYSILIQNEDIRKFLEYEMKLDIYLADMQKAIGDGIKEMLEF
ncbi:MAG: YlbF family regulator [Clostridia bacterium]|nr:YlbF family regulator [Clostridia bacterium]